MTGLMFDKEQIERLLNELGTELINDGVRAEMFIVGGAAMALAYNTRRATRDIDAVFEPKQNVYQAAARVGSKYGLPADWLNDSVKGLLPGADPEQRTYFESPGISISVASPKYLLALKVAAARVDRDTDDIQALAKICGLSSADEILTATEQIMGERRRVARPQKPIKLTRVRCGARTASGRRCRNWSGSCPYH